MLEDCKNAQERWGGVHQLIDRWLAARQALLADFSDLKQSCDDDLDAITKQRIDAFSELLMDYISAGHFEVYPQLRGEAEAFEDNQALSLADRLLERLDMSTELVLAFDEDYSSATLCEQHTPRLPAWLERLHKGLAERFSLEDQLISRLHVVHAPASPGAVSDKL